VVEPLFDFSVPPERLTIFTPLGIRFWDPARETQVTDGLIVTARPPGMQHATIRAFRTASGVYAFQGLPGLHAVEYPTEERDLVQSPLVPTRFIIEVVDAQRRFLPAAFGVDVPYLGVFPTETLSRPLGKRPPGFYLFSSPTRPVPSSLAVVRAQLVELVDAMTQRPAAHAVLEITLPNQKRVYGVADERGCAAVLFPYPPFTGVPGISSPPGSPPVVRQQGWEVEIHIRYAPATLSVPVGSTIPDLRSIFQQAPGVMWSTLATHTEHPVARLFAELVFGQELVLRSGDSSTLLISPVLSPP
jgi:hypothetical protein